MVLGGDSFKLFKKRYHLNVGKFKFARRVCEEWNRLGDGQISRGQATMNFACSCAPDHAEKEVRPNLRRHPRQAPLASSRAKDPIQDWGVGLPMSPWERTILPIGDCSLQRRMSLVVGRFDQLPVGTWSFPALELLDMAQACSPSLVHLSGTHFLSDCGTSAWLSLSLGDSWKPSCLETHMALTCKFSLLWCAFVMDSP